MTNSIHEFMKDKIKEDDDEEKAIQASVKCHIIWLIFYLLLGSIVT